MRTDDAGAYWAVTFTGEVQRGVFPHATPGAAAAFAVEWCAGEIGRRAIVTPPTRLHTPPPHVRALTHAELAAHAETVTHVVRDRQNSGGAGK